MRRASWLPRVAVGAAIVLSGAGLGAQPASAQGVCLLGLVGSCSSPTPSESPSETPSPRGLLPTGILPTSVPVPTGLPSGVPTPTLTVPPGEQPPRGPSDSASTPAPQLGIAENDPKARFSSTPAQLRGTGMTITGLTGIGVVEVPVSGGGTISAIEIDCASLVVDDLWLKVLVGDGHGLLTTSSRLELSGHVQAYVSGLAATGPTGPIRLDLADLPDDLKSLSPLSDVTLSYVGSTSDGSTWADTHEQVF